MIEWSVILSGAWTLLKEVSLGVGANELHRQLVERFQRVGAADLDLQKVLYSSLCEAVNSLGKTFSAENLPYFLSLSNLKERHDEQERVKEIFMAIRAQFPEASALKSPITIILEDTARTEVKALLARLGLESHLAALPETLRHAFESNLPFAMLAHFRQQVATDNRLHALLQLDLTTAGFQAVQRELRAISNFLHRHCGSDDPAQIQFWAENLTGDLKNFLADEFKDIKGQLSGLESKIDRISAFVAEIYDQQQIQHLGAAFYPIRGKLVGDRDSLPYHQLGGAGLERLCYLLLLADSKVPRYFGNPGQKQYGIDLLVTEGHECTVYQCKNVKSFFSQEVVEALRYFEAEWLGRSELPKPTQFALVCPLPLRELRQNEAWTKLEREFYAKTGVAVVFWDRNYLDERLRHLPDIVADLFSDQAAERFCNLDHWNSDLFRPVTADSGEKAITRYLEKKVAGQIYVAEKLVKDFAEKLERNGSLLIQGLPGSGKTVTGLALAESLHDSQYRVFYMDLRHDIDEDTLVNGIRRRLSRPTIFLLDDCHGKFEMLDKVQNRLSAEMRGKGFLVFMARTTPTPEGLQREDDIDFVISLKQADATLEFRPTLEDFRKIIELSKPDFAGLSKQRLQKIFDFTGRDLFLLDQLLQNINAPHEIDDFKLEKLFAQTRKHYFGAPVVHCPGFMKLAALAQFDLAPLVSVFPVNLKDENEKAAAQLLMMADHPGCYFFLHSSAAELVFRSLAVGDYVEIAAESLINFFNTRSRNDATLIHDLSNVIRNRLKLVENEAEENRLKSRLLSDDNIYSLIEAYFDQLPLNLLAICLIILQRGDLTVLVRYQDLVQRKIDDGTVYKKIEVKPFWENSLFLYLLKAKHPALHSNFRKQFVDRGLRPFVQATELQNLLVVLSNLAEPDNSWWIFSLDAIPEYEFDTMIKRTIDSGRSIGTIHMALRELKEANPAFLEKLEHKIGAHRYLHLIARAGTIFELFRAIQYSSPSMAGELIESLDVEILDALIAKTIASGRSIGTISFALRELKEASPILLEKLEHKIGAHRYLHLIARAGTIFELFNLIRDSSLAMAGELIEALDAEILDALIAKTIASGRSIGTINFALWELKKASPALLEKLEHKIGAHRYLHLIARTGTIFELFNLIRDSSLAMAGELIESLDAEILDALIAKTIASSRSIGNIHWALRDLKETNPALLEKLERKIGAKRLWQLICVNGSISDLGHIWESMDKSFKRELIQASQNLSLTQWQELLLHSSFADLAKFVRWHSPSFSKQFTGAFLGSLKPTLETLIDRNDWEALNRGAGLLAASPDSTIKNHLSQLLHNHLATVDLGSLHFDAFGEAVHCTHLLWQNLSTRRKELTDSLLTILPEEKSWHTDEEFLRAGRHLFLMLANPQARPEDARRVLATGNGKEVAALCAEATTLDLFLYLWNLYSLWFQWEREGEKAFAAFLHSEIRDTVSNALAKRLQTHASQEETDNQIALAGFLSFAGLAEFCLAEKAGWPSSLPSFNELVKRVQTKKFIPGFFFLLGLEWIFDRKGDMPQHIWRRLLPKAEAYTEKTAALDHLRDFVRAHAGLKK